MNHLNKLTKKNAKFKWTSEYQAAFPPIKNEIASERILCHFDPKKKITLGTDASPFPIGAVISHVDNDGEWPIAFTSKTLTKTESQFSQLDKENFAIFWRVKKLFNYLYSRKFTMLTNCHPLKVIFGAHTAKPSLCLVPIGILL